MSYSKTCRALLGVSGDAVLHSKVWCKREKDVSTKDDKRVWLQKGGDAGTRNEEKFVFRAQSWQMIVCTSIVFIAHSFPL